VANVAFSYLRFSTPEQGAGDSRRRQLAMAEKYAADHHLTLDQSLSFRDIGVSAFRGKNAKEGALRAFLDAIGHKLVPPNSFLLIESLDRLSRDRLLTAQALFLQIVQAGVTIVTLIDQRSYSLDSLNENPFDLIISLVSMMRANEESEMRSHRVRAAFAVKLQQLSTRPWSAQCPGWLRLDKQSRTFSIVEERADIVRRIYRETLAGVGQQTIVRGLNEDRVPLFGHGTQRDKIWQLSFVRHLLRTMTVIGTHVPCVTEYVDGVRRLRPQTPVESYYPAIIERADWDRVQARRAAWSAHYHNNVPKSGRSNLLARLSRCPYCDRLMVLLRSANPRWQYLICRRAFYGTGCTDRWVRYSGIEDVLINKIDEIIKSCPKPSLSPDVRDHWMNEINLKLRVLRRRRASMDSERALLRHGSRPVLAAIQKVDGEIHYLLEERRRMRVDPPRWLDLTLTTKLDRLRAVAKASVLDRHEFHSILRSLFSKVVGSVRISVCEARSVSPTIG